MEVIELWEGRSVPLQLNGASGIKKRITSKPSTPTTNSIDMNNGKDKLWNNYEKDEHIGLN